MGDLLKTLINAPVKIEALYAAFFFFWKGVKGTKTDITQYEECTVKHLTAAPEYKRMKRFKIDAT